MIFGKKNKNVDRSVNLAFVDGLKEFNKGNAVEVSLTDLGLRIKSRINKEKLPVTINYGDITAANCVSEKEILEKSKSVIGRAVVGGVLLGPLGSIIGGMSGIGNKSKSETKYYMVLNTKDENVISFEIIGASLHWDDFIRELRTKI